MNERTKDAAQRDLDATNIRNQLPGKTLPPGGPSGNGYPAQAHASTHEDGGSDALDLGSITGTIDDTQHGARAGGSLHANVVAAGAAGFMTGADKTKLDGIAPGATANVGTVTSVGLTAPAELAVAGTPVTASGTLALSWAAQAANLVFSGPATGAAAAPTLRALVNADMPAQPIPRGTAFPGSPATNDLYFRTDRGLLYYYDGTRWLTVHEYEMDLALYQRNAQPYAGAGATIIIAPARTDYGAMMTRAKLYLDVIGTNNGSNYWTISVAYCGTVVWTPNTSADAANAAINKETALSNVITSPAGYAGVDVAKVGSPSAIALNGALWYRLIG